MSRRRATETRSGQQTGAGPGASLLLPGWGRRTDVEQVDLYTRGSLYAVGWFLLTMGALSASVEVGSARAAITIVAAALVLGVLMTWWLGTAMRERRTSPGPAGVPWGPLAATTAVATALAVWGSTMAPEVGFAVALLGTGTLGWGAGSLVDPRWQWVVLGLTAVLGWVATSHPFMAGYTAFASGFFLVATRSSLWLLDVVTELDRARGSQAALAVAEERLRFSRDVHDVLGRHLSTIAVQAELAATLADRGDERTAQKVLEVRASAHEALREARQLARGYRPLDLEQELDGAVSLLRSAGIRAEADLGGLPEAWHEPVARVVREAVTNVLRHSDAARVEISREGDVVQILDDGSTGDTTGDTTGTGDGTGDGTGLISLREDLAPLGAVLDAGRDDDGFRVTVTLGAPHPAGARP